MFGDLLDEFASDQWGVKLNHPQVSIKTSIFDKTNMAKSIGEENYLKFIESLDSIDNTQIKELLNCLGNRFNFKDISESKSFVNGNDIQLSKEAFDGTKNKTQMQVVFHELGHAIDNIGVEMLDSDFDRISVMPEYKLKNAIKKDLLNVFNNDLKEANGDKIGRAHV